MKDPIFFITGAVAVPADEQPKQIYTVKIADNFHFMDDSDSYSFGDYGTYDEAEAVCKAIVGEDFAGYVAQNIPAEKVYDYYKGMGTDPWIFPDSVGRPRFSAWVYAKQLAEAMVEQSKQKSRIF